MLIGFSSLQAQNKNVGINTATPDPSAILDIYANDKGFLGPVVALQSRTDQAVSSLGTTPAGMMVYNTTVLAGNTNTELIKSYYYWNGTQWVAINTGYNNKVVKGQEISFVNTLGYTPTGYVAGQTSIVGPVSDGTTNTYTRLGCYKWTTGTNANNHTYCAYKIGATPRPPQTFNANDLDNQNATWANAFNVAKALGGYLPTITKLDEWNVVKANILPLTVVTTYKVSDFTSWIGMNKVTYAGNAKEFIWITGERSSDLGNTAVPFGPFNAGEPNDTNNDEGCVHILSPTVSLTNEWNDLSCTDIYSARFGVLLVEFNN